MRGVEVVRKGTNSKRMKRMCEYYSKSFVLGTATTPPLRQKRRTVAPCGLSAPQPPNEPHSPLLAATAALCHVRADLERSRLTPNAKFRPNRRGYDGRAWNFVFSARPTPQLDSVEGSSQSLERKLGVFRLWRSGDLITTIPNRRVVATSENALLLRIAKAICVLIPASTF